VRGVYLLNSNPNIVPNVFIDVNVANVPGVGAATVQLAAPYTDPSSGLPSTNYLYLRDDYLGGANNPFVFANIPYNYTFTVSSTPLVFAAPTPSGFPTNFMFSAGTVTNTYSYTSVQFSPTTIATNPPTPYATNYLAILPGRIEINATNELNLTSANISGPNYISINAPHQFDGSSGAQIYAPYADINLGVTNGFLTLSNLLQSGTERWNGTLQAWSATWLYTDTNGVTYDYRFLLVDSQLSPTVPSTVQNMTLHGTNSIVISDDFNIDGTLSADARNLTLTTNGPNANTRVGELNIETPSILWGSSLPNLRNLTNYGIINLENVGVFGAAAPSEYYSFINSGTISDQGSLIWADNFTSSGVFSNGLNQFTLQSQTATLTNSLLVAGQDISFNTGSLFATNSTILSGQQLLITAGSVTDNGSPAGNFWSAGGNLGVGLDLPVKPSGDLLGTTITNIAPDNEFVVNTWPGQDYGATVAGYSNNVAVGQLILDSLPTTHSPTASRIIFTGTAVSNAMYVDQLVLADAATNLVNQNVSALGGNGGGAGDNDNVIIYYARAIENVGTNVYDKSEKLNYKNNGRLRWVPGYAGYFSSTNIVYTNIVGTVTNISTNTVNAALAQSNDIDSDGDGTNNLTDPTPFFVSGEVNFKLTVTNKPPLTALISWQSIPAATNYVYYKTNLLSVNWQVLTNFVSPAAVPPVGGWPITNIISDVVNPVSPRYYRVGVKPNNSNLYGP
jgi:hypothetical protein